MISNENVVNYKVIALTMIYNFGFGRFSIRSHLKKLFFKIFFKTLDTNLRL
jgi:hypothetical protein